MTTLTVSFCLGFRTCSGNLKDIFSFRHCWGNFSPILSKSCRLFSISFLCCKWRWLHWRLEMVVVHNSMRPICVKPRAFMIKISSYVPPFLCINSKRQAGMFWRSFVGSCFFKSLKFNYSVGEVFFHHFLVFKVFPLVYAFDTYHFHFLLYDFIVFFFFLPLSFYFSWILECCIYFRLSIPSPSKIL